MSAGGMQRGKEKSISRIGAADDQDSSGHRADFCVFSALLGPGLEPGAGHHRHCGHAGKPAVPGLAVYYRRADPPPQLLDGDRVWMYFFVPGGVPPFEVPLPPGDRLIANKIF